MEWLEMHNVEFGECVVLGGKKGDILMVDCGSINTKIRENDLLFTDYVTEFLMPRYADAIERQFLLTHFHLDHLAGFRQILRERPMYFHRIYLPTSPADRYGRPLLIEFALYVFAFLGGQSDYAQMSISALRIFEKLRGICGTDSLYTLARNESFRFDDTDYDVLWPPAADYEFSELFTAAVDDLDVCLSSPFLGGRAPEFLRLKQEFGLEYVRCCGLCLPGARAPQPEIDASIDKLKELLDEIEDLSPQLKLLPTAPDVAEILSRPVTGNAYSTAMNAASVVFHNRRGSAGSYDDILMTGDAAPETLDAIAGDLYDGYYILKAPHHGTASGWSHILSDMQFSHILISSGDYHAGGKISPEYCEFDAVRHCTNSCSCDYALENKSCCNRTSYCWEQNGGSGPVLKCSRCMRGEGEAGCRIYIVSPRDNRSCLCDA